MASENTETNAGNHEETGPSSESNEHDYAHSVDTNFTSTEASSSATPVEPGQSAQLQPSSSISVDLPEPAVGAEVDCPGGADAEVQAGVVSQKTSTAAVPRAVPRSCGRQRPKRPEDRNCSSCKLEFERQGRSFNRRAVFTFTTPDTVHWVFPGSVVHEKSFMCETCAQVVRSKCKRKQTGKRSLWLKPPTNDSSSQVTDTKMLGRRMGKKSKAALLVSKSSYKAALQMLWSAKGARKPMMQFWSKQLKKEMKVLSRHVDSPFHQKVADKKPLSSFPWRRCLNWAQDKAPLVATCLRSLFPDVNTLFKSNHQLTEEHAFTLLERRTVVALSIPLFTRNIWRNNFLQAALGAELRLQGCSGAALDTLNSMGLCQNKDTVRLLLHRLRNVKDLEGDQLSIKQEQMKEVIPDMEEVEEEEEEDDDEEEEEEDKDEEEEDDDDDEDEEDEMVMAVEEEEVEEEEVQDGVEQQEEEEEEEDRAAEEKEEKKRRKKAAKKQRKEEKRKERGKRKAKEREEDKEEEHDEDGEGSEQKKRRVVVVRLGLLKGHSEVGRSDLSAP